jgi:hypothetical protein
MIRGWVTETRISLTLHRSGPTRPSSHSRVTRLTNECGTLPALFGRGPAATGGRRQARITRGRSTRLPRWGRRAGRPVLDRAPRLACGPWPAGWAGSSAWPEERGSAGSVRCARAGAGWPSSARYRTWRPCSTSGCRRRPGRRRARAGRSGARYRTASTERTARGDAGRHAAWPSMSHPTRTADSSDDRQDWTGGCGHGSSHRAPAPATLGPPCTTGRRSTCRLLIQVSHLGMDDSGKAAKFFTSPPKATQTRYHS